MNDLATYITGRYDVLKGQRMLYEPVWNAIIKHIQLSDYTIYSDLPKGSNLNAESAFDATAAYAAGKLAANINSVMTNKATEWFQLESTNPAINEVRAVKLWLEEATKIIRKELENSNFYTELLPLYYSLTTIGTGCMYIEADGAGDRQVRYSTRHMREVFVEENSEGAIDTVFRKTKMTARQMNQRWGDSLAKGVKDTLKTEPSTEYEVLHAVYPREDRDTTKQTATDMKFASVWLDVDNTTVMDESGYNEFPYVVPRWDKLPGEVYGTSPAYIALADVLTLNDMKRSLLKIAQKVAEPPMFVDGALEHKSLRTKPNQVNYGRAGQGTKVAPLQLGQNPQIASDMIDKLRGSIADYFYNNQLSVLQHKKMTAEEVRALVEENWRILGAVFNRLQSEMIEGIMNRTFSILQKSSHLDGTKLLPEVPEELIQFPELRLRYISQLARAQMTAELGSIINPVNQVGQLAELNPAILDNFDWDRIARHIVELNGAPPDIVVDIRKMNDDRQARQKQQEQMMAAQQDQANLQNMETESKVAGNIVDTQKKKEEVA